MNQDLMMYKVKQAHIVQFLHFEHWNTVSVITLPQRENAERKLNNTNYSVM